MLQRLTYLGNLEQREAYAKQMCDMFDVVDTHGSAQVSKDELPESLNSDESD